MGLYQNPHFVNNQAPALNATNMNNLANAAEHSQSYELPFTIFAKQYADASAADQAAHTNYWDNQNIVVTGTQGSADVIINNYATFKDKVGDVEGTYTFTWTNGSTPAEAYWSIDGVQIPETIGYSGVQGITLTAYGITLPGYPLMTEDDRTAEVTLTFDALQEQKISLDGITDDLVGSVGVSQDATKTEYDASAYAQFRCIEQGEDYLKIVTYGVKPTINIPCVVTVTGDGQVHYND